MNIERCTNCNVVIGKLEKAYLYNGNVVCQKCNDRLRGTHTNEPAVPDRVAVVSNQQTAKAIRRHGIFYYVFWGTVSLFITLIVLSMGFLFLTSAGIAFLGSLTGGIQNPSSKSAMLRSLPPLNESESQKAIQTMRRLQIEKDPLEGSTSYQPDMITRRNTPIYFYVIIDKSGEPKLHWWIKYSGDHWLFIQNFRIKVDQNDPITLTPTEEIYRGSGVVLEIFDEPADMHVQLLNQIMSSKTTLLRMQGNAGFKDVVLSSEELQFMRDMLLVYRYLGGQWPAD